VQLQELWCQRSSPERKVVPSSRRNCLNPERYDALISEYLVSKIVIVSGGRFL
jgi:hypothetical protein